MARPVLDIAGMRALALAILIAPAVATAQPVTVGVQLGLTQPEMFSGMDPDRGVGLFGRIGLTSRLAVQLEVMRIDGESDQELRTGTALLVVELASGSLVPTLLVGAGIDRAKDAFRVDPEMMRPTSKVASASSSARRAGS